MCQNTFIIEHSFDQHFDLTAAGFAAKQTGRNDASVVEHQQVARIKLVEQVGESPVRQRTRRPIQRQ